MAHRNVYGLDNSENGWEMVDQGSCVWVLVPGTSVHLQIREGQPAAIMGAFAADFNAFVEPLRDADSACWTATNSVPSSNHLSATAMDLNWNSHRFQISYDGFDQSKIDVCRDLLDFYEGMIFWGQDWDSPKDCMHWQMGYNTYGSANVDKVQNFIARKIRADGYSTFRRNDSPAPPPPPVVTPPTLTRAEGYAVRIINTGRLRGISPKGIQIALATGLVESNITVYANQKLPKSLALPHDAVGNDGYSVGIFQQQVMDTGNGWWWGDEATCMGVESSAGLFYDRLVKLPYNGTSKSPGAFAQQIQGSAFPDRYDQRWDEAVALYNKLVGVTAPPPDTSQGDDMAQVPQEQWDRVYRELTQLLASRSPLRHLGEGPIDTLAGFVLNADGSEHVEICRLLAGYGHPPTLELLNEVASADHTLYPDRQADAQMAQAILAEVSAVLAPSVTKVVETPAPQVVYAPALAPTPATPSSTGQIIGQAYDALEALQLSGVLSDTEKAPLLALIGVLQTKTTGAAS
jgi:hypothetical protein